jgi:hypothetical protein
VGAGAYALSATLNKVLDYLITVLPKVAHVHSTEDLNTTNALIPLIAYLARNNGIFADQRSSQHAFNWLYAALMWARYTAQTDQRLEADLSIVAKEVEPGPRFAQTSSSSAPGSR